jgi:CTP synthase (UTP-ammonia lyase)
MTSASIAIIGDFKPENSSHRATNEALCHCAAARGLPIESRWVATTSIASTTAREDLAAFSGFWIAPASPYASMEGALSAIRFAREEGIPLLGTCGGFQHIILEYARNVLGFTDAEHEESAPGAARLFISRLACSLAGRSLTIRLEPASLVARLYGRPTTHEQYYCNFGVNPAYVDALRSGALRIVGSDDEGTVRAVELSGHPFYVGTLFLPQHSSTPASPHPVISGFIEACCRVAVQS